MTKHAQGEGNAIDGPVLVTGGAGFVGANLVRRLIRTGSEVHLLLNEAIDIWRIKEVDGWSRHDIPLNDEGAVRDLMAEVEPRAVFHLAAHGAYSWQLDEQLMIETNILGTRNLLRAAADNGVDAFVTTGSSSEYGFASRATHEDDRLEPNSTYALTKAAATMYCRLIAAETGMWAPIVRLYSVYGPWEDPGRLFPALVGAAREGRLPVLAHPDTARDFVYVDDVLDALVLAATSRQRVLDRTSDPARIFNIGSGRMTTLRTLVEIACQVFNVSETPDWGSMADRSWDAKVWLSDPTRAWTELGWKARVDLRTGLRGMGDWMVSR